MPKRIFYKYIRGIFSLILYHAYIERRILRTDSAKMMGFSLVVPYSVFHPKLYFSSAIMARCLEKQNLAGARVLDLGCGSGILSLVAARKGASVVAVDLNPMAVKATNNNSDVNGLSGRILAMESNLFDALSPRDEFDLVVWNPPFFEGVQTTEASRAWVGGENQEVVFNGISQLGAHLAPSGRVLLILSSDMEAELHILTALHEQGYSTRILSSHWRVFETFRIYDCNRMKSPFA